MKSLLDNKFAPLTFRLGFIEVPLPDAAQFIVSWMKSLSVPIKAIPLCETLPNALLRLDPLVTPRNKVLLLKTRSPWSAYFDNSIIGGDPASVVSFTSSQMKCRGIVVTCAPHTMTKRSKRGHGSYGAVMFELYSGYPKEYLNSERAVWLANDGGKWKFGTSGDVQSFEQTERYNEQRLIDRFTCGMLEDYCKAFGINLFEESFYGPECVLLTLEGPQPAGTRPRSLAEVRTNLDLDEATSALEPDDT